MTWPVTWNGKEYDVDPADFSGLELSLIKQRIGMNFGQIVDAIGRFDGDAIRALFWIVDRRDNPDLKFTDYEGPSVRVLSPSVASWTQQIEDLGKVVSPEETPETSGSGSSPSSPDGPGSSTTD